MTAFKKGRRMRIFAGPNGSGKSTIFNKIDADYDVGAYINPDEIEKELIRGGQYDLDRYHFASCTEKEFQAFCDHHSLIKKARSEGFSIGLRLDAAKHCIVHTGNTNSYEASLLSDFLRYKLIDEGHKLSFETVMSHPGKLEIMDYARKQGYKVYLYFICTEGADINIDRVKERYAKGGHNVPEHKIEERYQKTLAQLKAAVSKSYKAFLWDNSGQEAQFIMSIENGDKVTPHTEIMPLWVTRYLLS